MPAHRKPLNYDSLREMYVEKRMTYQEIADFFKVAPSHIGKELSRAGIPSRPSGYKPESPRPRAPIPENLADLYLNKLMSQCGIGDIFGVSQLQVRLWLKRAGIPIRSKPLKGLHRGSKHSKWRGGIVRKRGRILIFNPDHPRASTNGYVKRAILVWEKHHGPVPPGWVVHHKNQKTDDDRIRNLKAMTRKEHGRVHAELRRKRH